MISQTLRQEGGGETQNLSAEVNVADLGNLPKQIMFSFVFGHFSWGKAFRLKPDLVIASLAELPFFFSFAKPRSLGLTELQENL